MTEIRKIYEKDANEMAGKDIEENGQKVKRLKEFFQDKKEPQTGKRAKKCKERK